jgi:hypothetical protein
MISNPVPIVNRMTAMNGFLKRTRFTSQPLACRTIARADSLLARNRSSTDTSTLRAGAIFLGARARLVEGAM